MHPSPPRPSPPGPSSSPFRNDPGQVGNFLFQQNMDKVEMKTHFALWSVMGSPLILGERIVECHGEPSDSR